MQYVFFPTLSFSRCSWHLVICVIAHGLPLRSLLRPLFAFFASQPLFPMIFGYGNSLPASFHLNEFVNSLVGLRSFFFPGFSLFPLPLWAGRFYLPFPSLTTCSFYLKSSTSINLLSSWLRCYVPPLKWPLFRRTSPAQSLLSFDASHADRRLYRNDPSRSFLTPPVQLDRHPSCNINRSFTYRDSSVCWTTPLFFLPPDTRITIVFFHLNVFLTLSSMDCAVSRRRLFCPHSFFWILIFSSRSVLAFFCFFSSRAWSPLFRSIFSSRPDLPYFSD